MGCNAIAAAAAVAAAVSSKGYVRLKKRLICE